jgi:ureidoacrylate peracid hydrolase
MKVKLDTRPESIELDLQSSALVVVDMQNAFAAKGGVFDLAGIDISEAAEVIGVVRQILHGARKAGMQVLYLQMGYKADLSDSGGPDSPNWHKEYALLLMRSHPELKGKILAKGTRDFEIVDELKPQPDDIVLVKSRYSGFAGTNLDTVLRGRGIRFLLFAGMATNVCVESTLRDAFVLDYWPILLTDATLQAGPVSLQEATIQNVENHFGWTLRSQEFLKALTQVSSPAFPSRDRQRE